VDTQVPVNTYLGGSLHNYLRNNWLNLAKDSASRYQTPATHVTILNFLQYGFRSRGHEWGAYRCLFAWYSNILWL